MICSIARNTNSKRIILKKFGHNLSCLEDTLAHVSGAASQVIEQTVREMSKADEIRALANKIETRQREKYLRNQQNYKKSAKYIRSIKHDNDLKPVGLSTLQLSKADPTCEHELQQMLDEKNYDRMLERLKWYSDLERHPSRNLLHKMASVFASLGNEEGISEIQRIAEKIYPKEYIFMVQYRHYLAEAYWKQNKHMEALHLFMTIYQENQHMRRKIVNMSSFFMNHIFLNKFSDMYEPLLKFANSCIEQGDYYAASNMWRWAFTSKDTQAHDIANNLLKEQPQILIFIEKKFDSIIKTAYEESDLSLLQRLVQTVRTFSFSESYVKVFGALINVQCYVDDLKGAKTSLHYCIDQKIPLSSTSIRLLLALFSYHCERIPEDLLNLKYKIKNPPVPELKW